MTIELAARSATWLVVIPVFAALTLFVAAALRLPPFVAVETWYLSLPQTNYVELIRSGGFRTELKVSSFRAHMIVLSLQLVLVCALAGWYWLHWRPHRHPGADGGSGRTASKSVMGSLPHLLPWLMALASAGVIALYATTCFLGSPVFGREGTRAACSLFAKEGPVDLAHAVGFLVSAFLFALAAGGSWRRRGLEPGSTWAALALGTFAAAAFVIGMEEISWGQTWFAWSSPDFFVVYNHQKETNAHNFFNNLLTPIYYAVAFSVAIGSILASIAADLAAKTWPYRAQAIAYVRPPEALIGVTIWLPVASEIFIYSNTEVFESVLTIAVLVYAASAAARSRRKCEAGRSSGSGPEHDRNMQIAASATHSP
ncbi:MAG: hypothetical protein KDE35_17575 [Geminicoccaceae bacterium]|nr:hypothetical protein [Geminicoccaceae bacterium]